MLLKLIMRNGPSASFINLLYVDYPYCLNYLVYLVSGGLSTYTTSSDLKTKDFYTHLSYSFLYRFCAAVSLSSAFSHMGANLAETRLRNMRKDVMLHKFDGIAA